MPSDVIVSQRSRPPHPTVWLEISYLGTLPPQPLFDDLEMIGWRPPVPASPPAWAIDWSAPNPATGERFSIREWTVEGAVAEPPKGSGFRGHWTESERDLFLLSLAGVLRRHGLLDEAVDAPAPPASAPAEEPAPPAPTPAVDELPPPPAATPEGAPAVVVRAVIAPEALRDRVAEALAPLPVTSHIDTAVRTITNTYRGTSFESRTEVLEVEALCEAPMREVVSAVLRDLGLAPTVHEAPTSGPLVARAAAAASDGDDADDADLVELADEHTSVVVLVVDADHGDRASALLARYAAGPVRSAPTTLSVTNTYRGTSFATDQPALRVACPTPAATAHDSAAEAAGALGLPLDDRQRVRVVRARATAEPAEEEAPETFSVS